MRPSLLLLHGYNSSSKSYFFPFLQERYKNSCDVFLPDLPGPTTPDVDVWTKAVLDCKQTHFTTVIAHSLGGALALSLLSRGLITADHLLLLCTSPAPKEMRVMNTVLKYPLEYEDIKKAVPDVLIAHSFDDPWTHPEYGMILIKELKARGIFFADKGHFETKDLPDDLLSYTDRWLQGI